MEIRKKERIRKTRFSRSGRCEKYQIPIPLSHNDEGGRLRLMIEDHHPDQDGSQVQKPEM